MSVWLLSVEVKYCEFYFPQFWPRYMFGFGIWSFKKFSIYRKVEMQDTDSSINNLGDLRDDGAIESQGLFPFLPTIDLSFDTMLQSSLEQ